MITLATFALVHFATQQEKLRPQHPTQAAISQAIKSAKIPSDKLDARVPYFTSKTWTHTLLMSWHMPGQIEVQYQPAKKAVSVNWELSMSRPKTGLMATSPATLLVGSGSFDGSSIDLSDLLPPAPDYTLPSSLVAQNDNGKTAFKLTGTVKHIVLKPKVIKYVPNVPKSVALRQIEQSGQAQYWLRFLGKDASGKVVSSSNLVQIVYGEYSPPMGTSVASASFIADGHEFHPKYIEDLSENSTVATLHVQWSTKSIIAKKAVCQVSTNPFSDDPRTYLDPAYNRYATTAPLPPKQKTIVFPVEIAHFAPSKLTKEGSDYYVRVVPLFEDGSLAGLPSNSVHVHLGPGPDLHLKAPAGPPKNTAPYMDFHVDVVSFSPKHDMNGDDYYHFVLAKVPTSGPLHDIFASFAHTNNLQVGTKIFIPPAPPQDKSFWDELGDVFNDIVTWVSDAVNWASQAYAAIQTEICSIVSSVTGIPESDLQIGLSVALVAMGLPPEIPNMDQLMNDGVDYLAEQAVQAAGVPPEAQDFAKDQLKDGLHQMAQQMKNQPSADGSFMKPDPDYGTKPAVLTLRMTAVAHNTTDPNFTAPAPPLDIEASGSYKDPSVLGGNATGVIFYLKTVAMPKMHNGETMTVPVCLEPYQAANSTGEDWNFAYVLSHDNTWKINGNGYNKPVAFAW